MRNVLICALLCAACSSSATNEDGLFGGSAGAAGQASGGDAGTSTESGCVPLTCADLGYTCGSGQDGCGNTIECGEPYVRHPGEDYPWENVAGETCPADHPRSWACGDAQPPGGDPPYEDCVKWPNQATWCCVQGS